MATLAVSSASNARKASARAAAVGPSTALRTSGRSMVTVVTGPSWSTRMVIGRLVDLPGVAAGQEGGQVAGALLDLGVVELGGHQLVVAGPGHLAEYADRGVREVPVVQAGQREGVGGVGRVGGVDQQGFFACLGYVYHFEGATGEESLLVHDSHAADPSYAFALSRLDDRDFSHTPIGIFRQVPRPSYDELMAAQLDDAKVKQGAGDLAALLAGGDTWQIH